MIMIALNTVVLMMKVILSFFHSVTLEYLTAMKFSFILHISFF